MPRRDGKRRDGLRRDIIPLLGKRLNANKYIQTVICILRSYLNHCLVQAKNDVQLFRNGRGKNIRCLPSQRVSSLIQFSIGDHRDNIAKDGRTRGTLDCASAYSHPRTAFPVSVWASTSETEVIDHTNEEEDLMSSDVGTDAESFVPSSPL